MIKPQPSILMQHGRRLRTWIAYVTLGALLSACGGQIMDSTQPPTALPPPQPATETKTAVPPRQPTVTITPTVPWWLAPRPREMEAYGLSYDEHATPRLPPESSISMPIWGTTLPVRTIDGEPHFISSPPPILIADPIALLEEAGCQVESRGDTTCPPESPLAALGCESIHTPAGIYPELGPDRGLVATCYSIPPSEDQPREDYLFRRGCAFRRNAAHIFRVSGEYILLSSPGALIDFFGTIESPEEALSYAQLMSGMVARFAFENNPDLLYFEDTIEGTRVTETDQGYSMNLFHFGTCSCEPFVNSEVKIMVEWSGEVIWLGAVPVSMTTGFSCVD